MLASVLLALVVVQAGQGTWHIPLVAFGGKKEERCDNRVFAIEASIGGGRPIKLALDTNVGSFVIAESVAAQAGLKPGSSISLDWANGERIRAAWIRSFRLVAGGFARDVAYGLVAPDAAIAKLYPLDGVVGLGFLQNYRWGVDPKRSMLTLTDPDLVATRPEGQGISFVSDRGKGIEIPVKVGGKTKDFVVHTGLSDVFVDKELAKELGLVGSGPVVDEAPVPYVVGPSITLEIGHVKIPNVQVFIAQKPGWRHIGQSVWNRFVTTWDMPGQRVYLRPIE